MKKNQKVNEILKKDYDFKFIKAYGYISKYCDSRVKKAIKKEILMYKRKTENEFKFLDERGFSNIYVDIATDYDIRISHKSLSLLAIFIMTQLNND